MRPQPIRNPFIEIAEDTFLIVDWFDIDDGKRGRDELKLVRLTKAELRLYDLHRCTTSEVGHVLYAVRKRLAEGKRRQTSTKRSS